MNNEVVYIRADGKLSLSGLRENQRKFVLSNKLNTGIVGGTQSGKSTSAVVKSLVHQLRFPSVPMAYYLPTYGLIGDMLIPKLEKLYDSLQISFEINRKESKFISDYGEIWMRSMNDYRRITSYSVGYSVIDEVDIVHPNNIDEVMRRITQRNSFRKDTPNSIDYVSTPEGFGYMYNHFVKKAHKDKELYRLSTRNNQENIAKGYIENMQLQHTEQQLLAYLDGEFVNLTSGGVYVNYDRKINNTDKVATEKSVLHVGIDFNVTNMSAIVHIKDNDISYAVDEFVEIYDTPTMIDTIKDAYPNNAIFVYPDASGNARKSVGADITDIRLLQKAGFKVIAGKTNPRIKTRINEVNTAFRNKKYFVNLQKCPNYADALEQIVYKHGLPDKTSGLDHITDAGGYFVVNGMRKQMTLGATRLR